MQESILLVGGGGHCKACIDVIEQEGKYRIAGIVDVKEKCGQTLLGYPYIGTDDDLPDLLWTYKNALITVGQIKSAALRLTLYNRLKDLNAIFPVILSPLAYLSKHAMVEEGTIIMHHALINAGAAVGANCIINSKALIEHEVKLGKHCHISTSSKINGQVLIGDECFVGSGVTIINNVEVVDRVVVPAGMTVMQSIYKAGVYIKS